MSYQGVPGTTMDFLRGLAANNNRGCSKRTVPSMRLTGWPPGWIWSRRCRRLVTG